MNVVCTGCFDLFHAGHLHFLTEAAKHGPVIALVDSDKRVAQLKGPGRPIIPQNERLGIVSSIKGVERAHLFDSDAELIRILIALFPHYRAVSREYVEPELKIIGVEYSSKSIVIDRVEDISTTKIIDQIKRL